MAFTPCSAAVAANIASLCDAPRVKGYEQIGILINRADIDWTTSAVDATNSRIITDLALKAAAKVAVIYNSKTNPLPFNGTQTEYAPDTDDYTKTLQFYYEGIGGGASKNVVEPLKGGEFVAVIPRKDHVGDGSFQVFGWQVGIKATAQVQNEETGYWLMTMTANEPSAEISLFDTSFAETKTAFDALVAKSF